ncbi:GNAT family N-acetyltransferase [Arthrobacter sp. MPF02]|uniref:GNAT family N-acetyltransferase n=1 Tax=Arthrobacter sp. MPF02 TaxID=3388492 RepID=UPI003984ED09
MQRLQEVEVLAGEAFRMVGMDAIADAEPPGSKDLCDYIDAGRCWVYTDEADGPVGYILVDWIDGDAHIAQVTVHPGFARRGIGGRLIEEVASWAAGEGSAALTLTTFRDVPWNRPYYERLGFVVVPEAARPEGIRTLVRVEAAQGLSAWPRVVMERRLGEGH